MLPMQVAQHLREGGMYPLSISRRLPNPSFDFGPLNPPTFHYVVVFPDDAHHQERVECFASYGREVQETLPVPEHLGGKWLVCTIPPFEQGARTDADEDHPFWVAYPTDGALERPWFCPPGYTPPTPPPPDHPPRPGPVHVG